MNDRLSLILKKYYHHFPLFIFWVANMGANFLNWLYNLFATKNLSLTDFGNLTLFTTFEYFIFIITGALIMTLNRYTAIFLKNNKAGKIRYLFVMSIYSSLLGLVLAIIYLGTAFLWTRYFQFPYNASLLIISSLMFILIFPLSCYKGLLNGRQLFYLAALVVFLEALIKLLVSLLSPLSQNPLHITILAVPISMFVTMFLILKDKKEDPEFFRKFFNFALIEVKIPSDIWNFLSQSIFLKIGVVAFVSLDLLFVKHYFSSEIAGTYAILSMVGKMIFFFSQSFIALIPPLISPMLTNKNGKKISFLILLSLGLVTTISCSLIFNLLPQYSLKFFIGEKYLLIMPYLLKYCLIILMITIVLAFSTYYVLQKKYFYSLSILLTLICEYILIILNHTSLENIIDSILLPTSILALIFVILNLKKFNKLNLIKNG
ncbi:hypothetical protein GYA19_00855 [Candidatus Beckwithbacteria bacterium]|nr:hypothetical protein [Candidatus Beckwithbacteria bacterium]